MKEGLSVECQMVCACASSKLEDVSRQLQTGEVTILDLQMIKREQQQMKRLCESASAQQKKTSKSMEMTYEAMIVTVDLRMQEFESFREQQGILLHLCHKIRQDIKGKTILVMVYVLMFYLILFQVSEKQRLSSKRIMIPTRSIHCASDLETPLT